VRRRGSTSKVRAFHSTGLVHDGQISSDLWGSAARAITFGVARTFTGKKRNFIGQHFWARGYFVSTVGRDAAVGDCIRKQGAEDARLDRQLNS
jgi:hypothetical protein